MKFYSSSELAEILHLSIHTVRHKIARGDFGDTLNTGRIRLVSQQNFEQYIIANTGKPQNVTTVQFKGKSQYRRKIAKL